MPGFRCAPSSTPQSLPTPASHEGSTAMIKTSEDRRVQTVLDAFDTLFNKRDYASAERFWSPRYIQHSAHIPPGRDGLFDLVKTLPATLRYETTLRRRLVISSFSMGGSAVSASRRRGSSLTSCAWRTECSRSTGTSSRTRPRGSNRAAVCRCSAINFRPDRDRRKQVRARLNLPRRGAVKWEQRPTGHTRARRMG